AKDIVIRGHGLSGSGGAEAYAGVLDSGGGLARNAAKQDRPGGGTGGADLAESRVLRIDVQCLRVGPLDVHVDYGLEGRREVAHQLLTHDRQVEPDGGGHYQGRLIAFTPHLLD